MIYVCSKCGKPTTEKLVSIYGEQLCEDCWDEYLFTDEGKVEYIVSIVYRNCKLSDFDADFLGFAAIQWYKNKDRFKLPEQDINLIESCAKILGIL